MGLPDGINLIDYTNAYIRDNRLNKTKLADMINVLYKDETDGRDKVSRPLISRYLNGAYDSDPSTIEEALMRFFESVNSPAKEAAPEAKQNTPSLSESAVEAKSAPVSPEPAPEAKPAPVRKNGTIPIFYESDDALHEIGICKACQEHGDMGVIIGRTGYGKTYVLKHYARRQKKVCYVECDDSMTSRDFIEAIEASIGMPRESGTNAARIRNIAEFFNSNEGYLLIIDEADKLMTKYSAKKMEILRGLYDKLVSANDEGSSGNSIEAFLNKDKKTTGIIIAGEPALKNMLKMYLPRFFDRSRTLCYELKGLSGKEIETYLNDFNFTVEAMSELKSRGTKTNFRVLDKTLKNIFRIVEPLSRITIEHVNRASSMMML